MADTDTGLVSPADELRPAFGCGRREQAAPRVCEKWTAAFSM